jgi:hypothetical protein
MKNLLLVILIFVALNSCSQEKNKVAFFSTTFGNSLHGSITLQLDSENKFLILKRVGSKNTPVLPPPSASIAMKYSEVQRDSINKVEKQYYLDYALPKTSVYKLTNEETKILNQLIDEIPKEQRTDFYPEFPMGDGFAYDFQIIYADGKVEDVEIQHLNVSSHEKLLLQMLTYAKKYEKDKDNIHVLDNFKDWNHPKY